MRVRRFLHRSRIAAPTEAVYQWNARPEVCVLEDSVEYALPFGPLGRLLGETVTER